MVTTVKLPPNQITPNALAICWFMWWRFCLHILWYMPLRIINLPVLTSVYQTLFCFQLWIKRHIQFLPPVLILTSLQAVWGLVHIVSWQCTHLYFCSRQMAFKDIDVTWLKVTSAKYFALNGDMTWLFLFWPLTCEKWSSS